MGKKVLSIPVPISPRINNEFTAQRRQDSMSMVTMTLHIPPTPVIPRAVRVFLVCTMSRMMIVRVRMTLSESAIEKYGRPN